MARLASQEKLGYYKTPAEIVDHIKSGLSIGPKVRMLDPCCGTGEALSLLAFKSDAETLGIELERGRFDRAKAALGQVLHADALTEAVVSAQSVDLLWLNPPYDVDEGDFDQYRERLEYLFLRKYLPVLAKNGVIVFIVSLRQLFDSGIRGLLARLSDLEVFRFPDGAFGAFRQVVVIGRKRMVSRTIYEENYRNLARLRAETLPTTEIIRRHGIRAVADEAKRTLVFSASHIDPDEILPLTATLREMFLRDIAPPTLTDTHPLMPLRQGHLAMLLAAGYVNGELTDGSGEHLVIKGAVRRAETVTDESTEHFNITKTIQKVEITVRALNLATGEIETVS